MIDSSRARRRDLVARVWSHNVVRYLVVGGICFAFDIALLWLLHDVFGVAIAVATPIAFLASFAVTYTLQRVVAFSSTAGVAPSVVRYALLVAFNTIATTAIVWAVDALGAGWVIGKLAAVISTTVWNFFAYRYWVFASPENRTP